MHLFGIRTQEARTSAAPGLMEHVEGTQSDEIPEYELSRLPAGERKWRELIALVSAAGDRAERHYLEMKSEIDPTNKTGGAKIAKFILGVANRDPDRAAKYFDGHGVLLLGVAEGAAPGLTVFEAKDMEAAVTPHLGDIAPRWDFQRISVSADRDVIAIIVDPPRMGDPIWVCCKEGLENLRDGDVYIRVDGATRKATAAEMKMLMARFAAAPVTAASLAITVSGKIARYTFENSPLDRFLERQAKRLKNKLPPERGSSAPYPETPASEHSSSFAYAWSNLPDLYAGGETRTRNDYLAEIADWEQSIRDAWPQYVEDLVAIAVPPIRFTLVSDTYLKSVEVDVYLDPIVRTATKPGRSQNLKLPSAPNVWGDGTTHLHGKRSDLFQRTVSSTVAMKPLSLNRINCRPSGSATLELHIRELRPGKPCIIDSDNFVLFVPADVDGPLTATWTATAADDHNEYSGTFEIPVTQRADVTNLLDRALERANLGDNS